MVDQTFQQTNGLDPFSACSEHMLNHYKNVKRDKVKIPRGIALAVLLLFAVSFSSQSATAAPSVYQFTVTGLSGPLGGVTSVGSFAFDPAIVPEGGGFVSIAGLFTHFAFSWDGINYDETTANTGVLGFEADGTLIYALFGTDCGPSGFGCGVGNEPSPHQWSFDNYYGSGAFYYLSPSDPSDIFDGTTSFMPISSPTSKNQCMKGGWNLYVGPYGPFKNQGDCIQFVNTGK